MADRDEKRYYWIKLRKDFFKRHDMVILESMPNGKDYELFYLKMLCESTSHEGQLRFSDLIPYNESMLSSITNTNIDIVRQAMKILEQLKMLEILDDGTIYMVETENMIGSETGKASKMRELRKTRLETKQIGNIVTTNENNVPKCNPEIELEIEKDINTKSNRACACEDPIDYFETNFGRLITQPELVRLQEWIDEFSQDVVTYAFDQAILANKKSFRYVEAILRDWKSSGVKSKQDAESQVADFEKRKTNKKSYIGRSGHQDVLPAYMAKSKKSAKSAKEVLLDYEKSENSGQH